MSDLLELMRALAALGFSKDVAERFFGWGVNLVLVKDMGDYETQVAIHFENGLIVKGRHFLNEGLKELNEDCEVTLRLAIDLTSHIRYNVFYGRYIHRTGYIRVDLGDIDDRLVRQALEDFYVPRLKNIYRPIIMEFKGFFSHDYFGIRVDNRCGELYYSPARHGREEMNTGILDVIDRLHKLEDIIRNEELRHKLAALDIEMSLLPNVMWM